ncbi:hypothetical protein [Pseudarthrobacter sulfonivorans]|nr:hypothetical protein [Pseudarthrobacter sulfonivorans]
MAIEHSVIVPIWNMLSTGTVLEDVVSDHVQRTHRRTTERHAVS